jgi:RNA polymerase sigma-70 factor (ECF subfamily)
MPAFCFFVEISLVRAIKMAEAREVKAVTEANNAIDLGQLLKRAAAADPAAMGKLFDLHRDRLRRMIQIRLDHRLQGRLDPSDVLQEAYLEFAEALPAYVSHPDVPFYLWLRSITGHKLHTLHRRHLGTRMRDARREISLYRGPLPEASSASLAAQLLGKLTTPSQACLRAELRIRIQEALNQMEALDSEVLALRSFEQLSNKETAEILGITEAAASIRFIRAVRRLKDLVQRTDGPAIEQPESQTPDNAST